MGKKRRKKPKLTPPSRKEAEKILGQYAEVDAKLHSLSSKMDEEITKVREKYSDDIEPLRERREELLEKLQMFAETNEDQFKDKKSLKMQHGRIGFRTGTPKLTTAKGFTWRSATKLIKQLLPDFIVVKEKPDKKGLLANRDNPEVKKLFPEVGVEVVQQETFFAEIKKEDEVLEQERKTKKVTVE